MTSSAFSCLRLFGIAVLTAGLSACATAPGPQFTSLPAPVADRGDVYVYRGSSLYGAGQAFTLLVDNRAIGELANASYAGLRLSPGKHVLTVDSAGLRKTAMLAIEVQAQSASFYEFDFAAAQGLASAVLMSPLLHAITNSLVPSVLVAHDQEQATAALGQFRSISKTGDFLTLEHDGAYATVDDVEAVPALDESQQKRYREWLSQPFPRAAVIADAGKLFLSAKQASVGGGSGSNFSPSGIHVKWAMTECQASGATGCVVYATNDRVVWVKP